MIAEQPRPAPESRRRRLVGQICLISIALGVLVLLTSLQPPPVAVVTTVSDWHLATHPTGSATMPGLEVHAGAGAATLAADLAPAAGPATIRSLHPSPVAGATPAGAGLLPAAGLTRDR